MNEGAPDRDRPMVLVDLLEAIERLMVHGAPRAEIEKLGAEYRRLRAEL